MSDARFFLKELTKQIPPPNNMRHSLDIDNDDNLIVSIALDDDVFYHHWLYKIDKPIDKLIKEIKILMGYTNVAQWYDILEDDEWQYQTSVPFNLNT